MNLTCTTCGKGPFGDARALGAHRVAHESVVCDDCGATVNRRGIGPHRRRCRPLAGPHEAELVELERLLRDAAGRDGVARVRAYVAGLADFPATSFLVVAENLGPYLVGERHVADVVLRARRPCVVVAMALAAQLVQCARIRDQYAPKVAS